MTPGASTPHTRRVDKMAMQERPLSPHLQVYKLPITALTSIMHRATGVALSAGTVLLVYWLLAAAAGPAAFATAQAVIGSVFGLLLLFGWSWALFYHLLNGARHLVWDAGFAFEIKQAELGSQIVVFGSAALTILAWIIGYAMM